MPSYNSLTENDICTRLSSVDALILCHVNPDADTLGSAFALRRIIMLSGGKAEIACADAIPERYRFLFGDYDTSYTDGAEKGKTVIAVDVAAPHQLGALTWLSEKTDIMIDHHRSGDLFADSLVDADASACGVIIMRIYNILKLSDAECARYLYAAISSDTGSFKYSNTTPEAHRCAGELVEIINNASDKGIDTADIARLLFDTRTRAELTASSVAIENTHFYEDGSLAITLLCADTVKKAGITLDDCGAVVDVARSVAGVLVGIAVKEKTPGEFRISARANTDIDVAKVCEAFGGGGHTRAAGGQITSADGESALAIISAAFGEAVRKYKSEKKVIK